MIKSVLVFFFSLSFTFLRVVFYVLGIKFPVTKVKHTGGSVGLLEELIIIIYSHALRSVWREWFCWSSFD